MGRGRQKAKQTKVARELKYHSSSIDVTALQRELAGSTPQPVVEDEVFEDDDDPYAAYAYEDEEDAEDEDEEPNSGYVSSRR